MPIVACVLGFVLIRPRFRPALAYGLFATLAIMARPISAQVVNSAEPPPTPAQTSAPPQTRLNPALLTVFIVGDSTARNQVGLGWCGHLTRYFDTTRINVANRAIAGRSSRTFIGEGAWDKVLVEMRPGDYILLQMGHNDGSDPGGPKPRLCLPRTTRIPAPMAPG